VSRTLCSLVVLTSLSCGSRSQGDSAAVPAHLACLSPDSGTIAYGVIQVDTGETGDASGVQFSFKMHGDTLKGFVRNATGETPPALPLQDLRSFAMGDSVSFWFGEEDERDIRRYRFTCEELSGTARPFVTPTDSGPMRVSILQRSPPITSP
jgi:hypothetical protein